MSHVVEEASVSSPDETGLSVAVPWLEITSVMTFTVLSDLLIFRGQGYGAVAVFLLSASTLILVLCFGAPRAGEVAASNVNLDRPWPSILAMTIIMGCVIARLVWLGSILTVLAGLLSLFGLAMVCSGRRLEVLECLQTLFASPAMGFLRIKQAFASRRSPALVGDKQAWLTWGVPVVVAAVFGGVFVFANPGLFDSVSAWLERIENRILVFSKNVSVFEVPFCIAAFFVGAGLLRPLAGHVLASRLSVTANASVLQLSESNEANGTFWYQISRNTLVAVISAFVAYLPFEFVTLWRREFPDGFYFAGYAHQGAGWLTVALVLATVVLSVIFHSGVVVDQRVQRLRKLAWIWSGLNAVLAIAVYNRLLIYVGYNGMTRLRTVGFFGITLVVVGFVLVVIKIHREKRFAWLIHAQLLAFAGFVLVYSVFPVDHVIHRYNVSRVNDGDPKPSVMVAVKAVGDEGLLPLLELLDAEDPIIREGVRAILARRATTLMNSDTAVIQNWQQHQFASSLLLDRMNASREKWNRYLSDPKAGSAAIEAFKSYAMKWY